MSEKDISEINIKNEFNLKIIFLQKKKIISLGKN